MLKVWGRRSSFNVQKVIWLIGELDLPHQHIDAGGAFGGLDAPAFLAMNPHGRVPVIRDDEATVWIRHPALPRSTPRQRPLLVRRSRCPGAGRRLDGLVADRITAGFSRRRVLKFFRTPEAQRNGGDQDGARPL